MKTITETKEIVVGYEAADGTRFASEKECRDYEESAGFVIENQFRAISAPTNSKPEFYASEDDYYYLVDLSTPERLTIANMWATRIDKGCKDNLPFKESMLGKKVVVARGWGDDWIWVMGTREDLAAYLTKTVIDPLFGKDET